MNNLELIKEIKADDGDHLWQGFYSIENLGDGAPFRWTGPETSFTIGFDVPRNQPLIFELVALKAMSRATCKNLFVDFDGRMILADHVRDKELDVFRVAAKPRLYGSRTKMVFHLPETKFEQRKKALSDRGRALGLAFLSLRILGSATHVKKIELPSQSTQDVVVAPPPADAPMARAGDPDRGHSVLDRAFGALRGWSKSN